MPYDKDGKYYRKPVYRVEETKKDLPLKKKRHIMFYFLGFMYPLVLYFFLFFISSFLLFLPPTILVLINSVLSIFYVKFSIRTHKSNVKNYLEKGGKLTKKQIFILAIFWWILSAIFVAVPAMAWLMIGLCTGLIFLGVLMLIFGLYNLEVEAAFVDLYPPYCEWIFESVYDGQERAPK